MVWNLEESNYAGTILADSCGFESPGLFKRTTDSIHQKTMLYSPVLAERNVEAIKENWSVHKIFVALLASENKTQSIPLLEPKDYKPDI